MKVPSHKRRQKKIKSQPSASLKTDLFSLPTTIHCHRRKLRPSFRPSSDFNNSTLSFFSYSPPPPLAWCGTDFRGWRNSLKLIVEDGGVLMNVLPRMTYLDNHRDLDMERHQFFLFFFKGYGSLVLCHSFGVSS